MPTTAQLQNIWLLSDTVLYPEAVAFMRRLVRERECQPLPNSQVNGLLSIAESYQYNELRRFVAHQYERDWQPSKRYLKTFYTALEETLKSMERRLRSDFHLLSGTQRSGGQNSADENELMALLAREFIQHLVAENGLLASKLESERRQRSQRNQPAQAGRFNQSARPHEQRQNRPNGR